MTLSCHNNTILDNPGPPTTDLCTWASIKRCLINIIEFFSVSFSVGRKGSSSSSSAFDLVTMKWEIWSFRVCSDCTAVKRQRRKNKNGTVNSFCVHARVCARRCMSTHAHTSQRVSPTTQCWDYKCAPPNPVLVLVFNLV